MKRRTLQPSFAFKALLLTVLLLSGTASVFAQPNIDKWGIHLTQVAPRRCGLVDP